MDIPLWLWYYADKVSRNFDKSHDMYHFVNTYTYAKQIIYEDYKDIAIIPDISIEDGRKIVYHASFCHDLIDGKYMDVKIALGELRQVFIENGYNPEHLEIILFLINNMSFSKQRLGNQNIPEKYSLALNIVSDADKLDAYRIERIVTYQNTKNTDPEATVKWIKTILVKRVLEYRKKWLKTPYAMKISEGMHNDVVEYVEKNLKALDMFDY